MVKRRRKSGVVIPWERHGAVLDFLRGAPLRKLVVGAALVGALAWVFDHDDEHARTRQTRAAITELSRSVARFRADHGRCPRGLRELSRPPAGSLPYVRQVPRDGWGHAFALVCPGRSRPDAAIRSRGPDGTWFGRDEIE